MKRFLFLLLITVPWLVSAQSILIDDFIVKENLSQNGKLAIIAVDSYEKADSQIQGTFAFSINGFQQRLLFSDGVAVMNDPIESSTFVFFKHKNQSKEIGRFYFIRKSDKGLTPYKLSGLMLILIPIVILLIAYVFKRFLMVFVTLAVVFVYLHFSKGLDMSQVLESFFFSIKGLF